MTMLFNARIHVNPRKRYLHLRHTTDPRGNYVATVPTVRAALVGALDESGEIVTVDRGAVRAALPHHWRKAWDRAQLWWRKDEPRASAELRTARGDLIGTVYFTPA